MPQSPLSTSVRRSARLGTYESNGRRYLADKLSEATGCTYGVAELESIITAPSVRSHLQHWYRLCIEGQKRFNTAIEWINTGADGYFYNTSDLEEDLLLFCLCEGSGHDASGTETSVFGFADHATKTEKWTTVELWARTAWRVVQALAIKGGPGAGGLFELVLEKQPATAYAWAIDLLCLAFHSIAHRGVTSRWRDLIVGLTVKKQFAWDRGRASWVEEFGEAEDDICEHESDRDMRDSSTDGDGLSSAKGSLDTEKEVETDVEPRERTSMGAQDACHHALSVKQKRSLDRDGAQDHGCAIVESWLGSFNAQEGKLIPIRVGDVGQASSDDKSSAIGASSGAVDTDATTLGEV